MAECPRILFVDAYDSFTQNIVALLRQVLRVHVIVVTIDADVKAEFGTSLEQFVQEFAAVVLGPGPGNPQHGGLTTGIFQPVIQYAARHKIPLLGICLGFQAICITHGLCIQRLSQPCHGHAKRIIPTHPDLGPGEGHGDIFEAFDNEADQVIATCYNSLGFVAKDCIRESLGSRPGSSGTNASFGSTTSANSTWDTTTNPTSTQLNIIATDEAGFVMAVAHSRLPIWGFQFHPESCKSNEACRRLLQRWFSAATTWNQKSRNYTQILPMLARHGQIPSPPLTTQVRSRTSDHGGDKWWSRQKLLKKMLEMAPATENRVRWMKVGPYHREYVADLVQSLCTSTTTNMLESTKKGRFSIYALTGDLEARRGSIHGTFHMSALKSRFTLERTGIQNLGSTKSNTNVQHERCTASRKVVGSIRRGDLLGALEDFMISNRSTGGPAEVPFWGGFLGFVSYEFGLDGINVSDDTDDPNAERTINDLSLQWVDRCLVHDNETSMVYIQSLRKSDTSFLESMARYLDKTHSKRTTYTCTVAGTTHKVGLREVLRTGTIVLPNRGRYNTAYDSCQQHLHEGNSYELCLTTTATIDLPNLTKGLEYALYKNMYAHNPVPYSAFLDLPDITIASTSPEEFMSWSRTGTINMLPMKGTVQRTPSMTLARATAILNTPKEFAENLMIADLIRHDLYTAVGTASEVEVVKLCEVVEHETVYQLISHIRAHAPIDHSLSADVKQQEAMRYGLRALTTSLPPGSMTGAPKKRSCEILRTLENRNRGLYSGAIGYLDVGGGGAWNVCIRTAFRNKDPDSTSPTCESNPNASNVRRKWTVGAGGAITVLSDRDGEWEEMMVKLGSVLKGFTSVATSEQ